MRTADEGTRGLQMHGRGRCLLGTVLFGILVPVLFGGEAPPAPHARGVRVEYRTRGLLPGKSDAAEGQESRQLITVDASGARLHVVDRRELPTGEAKNAVPGGIPGAVSPGVGTGAKAGESDPPKSEGPAGEASRTQTLILRMDRSPPLIHEVLQGGRMYREHSGELHDLQKDRRIAEKNELELARTLSEKEREAFFKENWWLRPDGRRIVEASKTPGETILGLPCDHLVVKENGRVIIDAQVTRAKIGARSYFHLYRQLGAFSEEVLEKLSGQEGLPLAGRITVVTALPTRTLEVEALRIEPIDPPDALFDLPAGAVRVDEVPQELRCGLCGKILDCDVESVPAKALVDDKWIYYCSEAHAEEHLKKRFESK